MPSKHHDRSIAITKETAAALNRVRRAHSRELLAYFGHAPSNYEVILWVGLRRSYERLVTAHA